jgi:putative hemolysin
MKWTLMLTALLMLLVSCTSVPTQPAAAPFPTQANMPNPASAHCEEQGFKAEIRTAVDGSQRGVCIFPDGSECDEWAYFRGECGPADQSGSASSPTEIPTAMPVDPADYQDWWTYAHTEYGFALLLPEDWIVEEVTTGDPLMNGHMLNLHTEGLNIRMAFRRIGEEVLLWPTGVGQGEFIQQGTLDVAGQPAQRLLLVCPTGEITAIWYHEAEGQPNITRGDMEFGFIYSAGRHCEPGQSLSGKIQRVGEMIIASLKVQ